MTKHPLELAKEVAARTIYGDSAMTDYNPHEVQGWRKTTKLETRECCHCGKGFTKPAHYFRRRIKEGRANLYCSAACSSLSQRRQRNPVTHNYRVENGCWIWQGIVNGSGYGQTSLIGGKSMTAHRAAWITANGEIPNGLHVLHKCDTPLCINPDHLFLGTHADNMADRTKKLRTNSKLTIAAVTEIRSMHKEGRSVASLAKEHGVSPGAIYSIVNRRTWRHVA